MIMSKPLGWMFITGKLFTSLWRAVENVMAVAKDCDRSWMYTDCQDLNAIFPSTVTFPPGKESSAGICVHHLVLLGCELDLVPRSNHLPLGKSEHPKRWHGRTNHFTSYGAGFGWDRLACVFIHGIQHAHKVRICSSRKKKLVTKPGNMFYCPTK